MSIICYSSFYFEGYWSFSPLTTSYYLLPGLISSCYYLLPWWHHQMETFFTLLAFVRGIHQSPVNSPHKGQWRGALMFSLICAWTDGWVNNRDAGDLRCHRVRYDITVMPSGDETEIFQQNQVNSLSPNEAIWRQGSMSTLVQVMACCLTAPSHYLNQCWLIVTKVHWCSSEGNFVWDITAISH